MNIIRRLPFYGHAYRALMRLAHRFNWHYMPPSYPDGDTMIWCHWCGARDVIKRKNSTPFRLLVAKMRQDPERAAAIDKARADLLRGVQREGGV